MNIFSKKPQSSVAERPSVLIKLKLIDKLGVPIDETVAWLALQEAFKNHPHFKVQAMKVFPDKDENL